MLRARKSWACEGSDDDAYLDADALPLGAVIAVAALDDVMRFDRKSLTEVRRRARGGELPPHEADFGDFSAGRYGWILKEVKPLSEPIPTRGMLGLWEVPKELEIAIERRI